MKHQVLIRDNGECFACSQQQNLLRGMEQLGRRGIPVGCRGGGCGVCKVQVLSGGYRSEKMSRGCVSENEQAQGIVLACRIYPEADLEIRVIGRMLRALQRPGGEGTAGTAGNAGAAPA